MLALPPIHRCSRRQQLVACRPPAGAAPHARLRSHAHTLGAVSGDGVCAHLRLAVDVRTASQHPPEGGCSHVHAPRARMRAVPPPNRPPLTPCCEPPPGRRARHSPSVRDVVCVVRARGVWAGAMGVCTRSRPHACARAHTHGGALTGVRGRGCACHTLGGSRRLACGVVWSRAARGPRHAAMACAHAVWAGRAERRVGVCTPRWGWAVAAVGRPQPCRDAARLATDRARARPRCQLVAVHPRCRATAGGRAGPAHHP